MRRLQEGGAADDLAVLARGTFEQHVDGCANRGLVEGRLLAVDQVLEPLQSLVHFGGGHRLLHIRRRRSRPGGVFERISRSVADLRDKRECREKILLALALEADDKI